MTANKSTTGRTGGIPIACSLSRPDLKDRGRRWAALAAQALTARANTAQGVRLSFRPGPGTEEELRALAVAETDCCAWATWTVHAAPAELILDVDAPGAGARALQTMFADFDGPA
jgi:hypothetical protein